jgi:hypothetical protein
MRTSWLIVGATFSVVAALAGMCLAGPPAVFDQVEEDWQLVIATPDIVDAGPQITTSMSPTGQKMTDPFVAFDMNYREYPDFVPGGMQVQVWSQDQLLATATQGSNQLNTPNETITWTQRMSVSGGSVNYAIVNGQSTTFGKFGQGLGLLSVSYNSSLADMSAYKPDFSVANSGASWQSNMVQSMTLLQVRYYLGGQLIFTDKTARPIDLSN